MAKKSLFFKMKSKICGGLLFLSNISLISLGFSSWVIGAENQQYTIGNVIASVGDVKENITIKQGVFYIFKSEYAFNYYTITSGADKRYVCTQPRIGFQIKINPSELTSAINNLSSKPNQLFIDVALSYTTPNDFDMFSSSNSNAVSPENLVFSLIDKPEYSFESEELSSSYTSGEGENTGTISSRTVLYKEGDNSLLEFTKTFSIKSENEYTYFDVYYPFELKDSFSFENYISLSFDWSVSLDWRRD